MFSTFYKIFELLSKESAVSGINGIFFSFLVIIVVLLFSKIDTIEELLKNLHVFTGIPNADFQFLLKMIQDLKQEVSNIGQVLNLPNRVDYFQYIYTNIFHLFIVIITIIMGIILFKSISSSFYNKDMLTANAQNVVESLNEILLLKGNVTNLIESTNNLSKTCNTISEQLVPVSHFINKQVVDRIEEKVSIPTFQYSHKPFLASEDSGSKTLGELLVTTADMIVENRQKK